MLIRCHSVTLTFDFKLDLELIQHFGCHVFKLYKIWAKSGLGKFQAALVLLPYPSLLLPFSSFSLPFSSSTPPSLFFPSVPSISSPSLYFPFPGVHPSPKTAGGSGERCNLCQWGLVKKDLVHIWTKKSSSDGNSFVDFCKNKIGKKNCLSAQKLIINRKGVPVRWSSCWETPVIKRRAYVFSAQLYIRQEVSWSQCSAADISHKHRRRKKSLVRGTMASPTPPLPSPSLPFLPLLSLTVSSPPLPSPFPYLSPFLTSHPLPFPLLEVGPPRIQLGVWGSAVKLPRRSKRSPAIKRILMHCRHKFPPFA